MTLSKANLCGSLSFFFFCCPPPFFFWLAEMDVVVHVGASDDPPLFFFFLKRSCPCVFIICCSPLFVTVVFDDLLTSSVMFHIHNNKKKKKEKTGERLKGECRWAVTNMPAHSRTLLFFFFSPPLPFLSSFPVHPGLRCPCFRRRDSKSSISKVGPFPKGKRKTDDDNSNNNIRSWSLCETPNTSPLHSRDLT